MTQRFYVMPVVGTGTHEDPRTGKHVEAINNAGYRTTMVDYGPEDWCIVRIRPEPTPADHATLNADADVFAFPSDISQEVGVNSTLIETRLEAVNIPGQWVTSNLTYRQVIERIVAYCMLMQRAAALAQDYVSKMFENGRTLDSTINSLPQAARNRLANAADSFGFDRSGIGPSTTFRDALTQIASQWIRRIKFSEDDADGLTRN